MNEEHFKALSQLVSLCREDNCDDRNFLDLIRPAMSALTDLRLEGEDGEDDEEGSHAGTVPGYVSAYGDDIQRVFRELQQKDTAYARLKKLYDVRLEVTREALVKSNTLIAALRSQVSDLQATVGELEAYEQWSAKHGPDPDSF